MVNHKNIVLNTARTIKKYISDHISTSIGGRDIVVNLANTSKEVKKPTVSLFIAGVKINTKQKAVGRLFGFRDWIDENSENKEVATYVNAKKYEIDVSLIIYTDSITASLDISGQVMSAVENLAMERIDIPEFSGVTETLNERPYISPKLLIENPEFIDLKYDHDNKSNSYTAVVRFPVITAYADVKVFNELEGVSVNTNVLL